MEKFIVLALSERGLTVRILISCLYTVNAIFRYVKITTFVVLNKTALIRGLFCVSYFLQFILITFKIIQT
jgi:hypothetical protein